MTAMTEPTGVWSVPPARASLGGAEVIENASLSGRNSFRVAARTSLLIDVHDTSRLGELLALPALRSQPLLILGEGSNILFASDWPGVVLSIVERGIEVLDRASDGDIVRVAAGENWNEFVHWALAHGYAGLENLVLIPGSVGAAPIQNIGAYGVELCEFVHRVEAWDRQLDKAVLLDAAQCHFAYRDSVFKQQRDRWLITAVQLKLPRQRAPVLDYAGVREALQQSEVTQPTAVQVATVIAQLRMRKLPNPDLLANAGSFFKNPILSPADAATLRAAHPDLPCWPADADQVKFSAAWLIEQCGFKGAREGDAGIAAQHALVLVNHGNASGAELLALARRIAEVVHERFDVTLAAEPRIIAHRPA